ncbi:recombinase RecT [Vagococcus sp. DIV0080]|uniref:Recombinase RecT n=1 Tax=Candidatus Vagococcus giribetii TaxID=2230876 RepID=A0ABS3HXL0_9ENTE|nr:recombinase RecT [Vagococcus sp. DIV0080]MBO0477932.1 recombinase RecT [Vagococcus sp. DIV0080]
MGTTDSLKNQLQQQDNAPQQADPSKLGFKTLMSTPGMKKRFNEVLNERSEQFMSSLMTLVSGDDYLAKAEPMTIIASAMKAATMDLPIDKNLGYAYIVPFNRSEKIGNQWVQHNEAQFIIGYKGYIQLAQRSGQYKALNAIAVYEGQMVDWNPLTEEFTFSYEGKISDEVIGYVGFFELLNGFKKTVYWTKQEVEEHRISNNKNREKTKLTGAWKDNYDQMAIKTVLRNMLSKWGILSIEMQSAVTSDEKVFRYDDKNDLIEETKIDEMEPIEQERKEVEKVEDEQNEEVQQELFNDKKLGDITK